MRKLRLADGSSDSAGLLLETVDGLERFTLPVDPALRDAVRTVASRPASSASDAKIPPRDIQRRVRSGESPEDLADDTGMPLQWVLRFAEPVLAERTRITDEAWRSRARRNPGDGETVPFGDTVEAAFLANDVEPSSVTWDAARRDDGPWTITARWHNGQDEQTARWAFSLAARTVAPANDTAADLLSGRPLRPVEPPQPPEPVLSLAPPLVPGIVAFPAMPDAHTGPLPRAEEVFDQTRYEVPPVAAVVPPPTDAEPEVPEVDEPPLPFGLPARKAAPDDAADAAPEVPQPAPAPTRSSGGRRGSRRTAPSTGATAADKNGRPVVPSWDDILLGVRRKND
jgi:hypothetical protein